MKTLQFSTLIDADPATVWRTTIDPDSYRTWTSPFCEGSYFEGSWDKGSRIRFLTPQGDGMFADIDENRPGEFISIHHLGMIRNGIEEVDSEDPKAWAPGFENYTFRREGGKTRMVVDLETPPDFEDFMQKTWPQALASLKAICESAAGRPR